MLTELACGCSRIGNLHGDVSEQDAQQTVAAALGAGIRYFDVAPLYANGLGEARLGQALREVARETYALSTKVGRYYVPLPPGAVSTANSLPFSAHYDYSYDGTMRAVEQSLLRLGTNRLDIGLIHDVDPFTHGDEASAEQRRREAMAGAYPALRELREQGVVGAIGVGVNDRQVLIRCAQEADFDCFLMANQYTLLRQDCLDDLLPLCEQKGIAIVACAPFGTGVLAKGSAATTTYDNQPADSEIQAKVRAMEVVCDEYQVSLMAASLQFPLAHPLVVSVVPGPRSGAHVHAHARAMAERIPPAFWQALRARGFIRADAPLPGEASTVG